MTYKFNSIITVKLSLPFLHEIHILLRSVNMSFGSEVFLLKCLLLKKMQENEETQLK